MNDLRPTLKLPEIPEEEQTPWVKDLVRLVGKQHEYIKTLEEEIRRLKGGPPKPKLRASKMDEQAQDEEQAQGGEDEKVRRPGPRRKKTAELTIHEERKVAVEEGRVPSGSRFKGYRPYVVQDLEIRPHNSRFLLEQWQTPDGRYITAEVPCAVHGGHYGPTLASFVLYQYHHNHVTQPLLRQQLTDLGTEISAGQLNTLVTEGHEAFHDEKADLKAAGLEVASYVQTDDTGARHQGRNGYCTYVGNDLFAWFETTFTKSRVNFLSLLQSERLYRLDEQALEYMARRGLGKQDCDILAARVGSQGLAFSEEKAWLTFLEQRCAILGACAQKVATEGTLVAGLLAQGLAADLGIVSDDAGQFNVFEHALCWIHAERAFRGLVPLNDAEFRAIGWVRGQIWALYSDLKAYRDAPDAARKAAIEAGFDALFDTDTVCTPLNQALARLGGNKTELLRVLERPELPLHNNLSERDLRDYAKKRKISASTRSELGRRCRDTFASLKKACRKHRLSFWDYLVDRVSGTHLVPSLPEFIRNAARE